MKIGVPKEPWPDQPLVAASPDAVKKLIKLGYEVVVERGAGVGASFRDEEYAQAGANLVDSREAWGSDLVLALDTPPDAELELM